MTARRSGSAANTECQIDSIAQSWTVLSGAGDAERARTAMKALDEHLVRRDRELIQLLDPPFDKGDLNPGYIKGYLPGVRENGGQYTHSAIWATMAFARLGDRQRAWELFGIINPVNHGKIRRRQLPPIRWSRTSWRPTFTPCRRISAAAGGPGTPVRRGGCTA